MSATLAAISSYNARNGRDAIRTPLQGKPATYFDEPTTRRPLREIAQEQAALLRRTHPALPARTRTGQRAEVVRTRVESAIARQGGRAPQRPMDTPVQTREARQARIARLNAMAAATPDGRYALPRRPEAGEGQSMYFFQITGSRIVMLTGGVGAFAKHPMNMDYQEVALTKIAADPRAAAVRFGHATSVCGRCGSPLTNDASVARGLGPDCAKAF